MWKMVNTRAVTPSLHQNYLQKAQECFASAQDAFAKNHWNSCVINAVYSGISAADALTVFHLSQRCIGERHNEVLQLIRQIKVLPRMDLNKKIQQLSSLLGLKNQAEYEEKLITSNEADLALKHAERFLDWAKELTR